MKATMGFYSACAGSLFVCLAGVATAAPVTVTNHSFEATVLGPGGWSDPTPAGWEETTPNSNGTFTEYLSPNFSSPALDGFNHEGVQGGNWLRQDLGVGVTPNTAYTLTVGVGRRNAGFTQPTNDSRVELWAGTPGGVGSTLLAGDSFNVFTLADLEMVDVSVAHNSGGAVPAGNLYVWLGSNGPGGDANRAHFDNVRLDATPVIPEPATLTLFAIGSISVLAYGRRRCRRA